MMLYRRIDDNGLFIEDCILETVPNIEYETGNFVPDQHYIETPCPAGLYHPKWDGVQWIEGGTAPEPVITVDMLKRQLADTDYRIIKCYEYQIAGLDLPYDITELHASRQAVRDKIAELEQSNT